MQRLEVVMLLAVGAYLCPAFGDVLNVPGSQSTVGTGINNSGEVVGYFSVASEDHGFVDHGFVYNNGVYSTFDPPGGSLDANKVGINDAGEIVGTTTSGAFLLANGSYSTITVPNSTFTNASAINNSGQIVGYYLDASGHSHTYIFSNHVYTTLPSPVSSVYESIAAEAINNRG